MKRNQNRLNDQPVYLYGDFILNAFLTMMADTIPTVIAYAIAFSGYAPNKNKMNIKSENIIMKATLNNIMNVEIIDRACKDRRTEGDSLYPVTAQTPPALVKYLLSSL